jgi:serine/threonine-protein kinase
MGKNRLAFPLVAPPDSKVEGSVADDPNLVGIPRPGDVVAGKYLVERIIGTGGMGVVLAAMHQELRERVALKMVRPEVAANPDLVGRFMREGRAAVKIRNEHVARVLDVGRLDGGVPYLVMEYLEGTTLSTYLQVRGHLPLEFAVDLVLQACEALADAHSLGIIHRDLKPENLFMTRRYDGVPLIKVIDFGIAKGTDDAMTMTKSNHLMGSPLYMSPEQMRSTRDVDARTDIWSLGTVLFECLAGRPPYNAESIPELYMAVWTGSTPLVRSIRSELPEELDQIIGRCLAKDRADRFATVGELALALAKFASPEGQRSARIITRLLQPRDSIADPATNDPLGPPSSQALTAVATPQAQQGMDGLAVQSQSTPLGQSDSKVGPPPGGTGTLQGTTISPIRTWSRSMLFPGIAALGALAVALTVIMAVHQRGNVPPQASADPSKPTPTPAVVEETGNTQASASPTSPVVEPVGKEIVVRLRTTTAGARFRVDDGPALENPFLGRFPRDDREHTIRVEAPGYEPQTRTMRFAEDVDLDLTLPRKTGNPAADGNDSSLRKPPTDKRKHAMDPSDPWK